MTKEKLEIANVIAKSMDELERVAKYKCSVDTTVLKDVIQLIGEEFYDLVDKKYRELNEKFKQI